jgi:hypothetical protein
MTDYNRVQTHGKTEPAVSETYATVVKAIHEFGGKLAINLQTAGQGMVCRYMCASISPRLCVTLILIKDKIEISLHSADDLRIPNDDVMPKYAIDLANMIRSATRNSKLVTFKQPALRSTKGG